MVDVKALVRPSILRLEPYSCARDEFHGQANVWLDANENPFGELNRYPDPHQQALKNRLAELNGVASENVFVGNGSDEVIDLVFRVFCQPEKDKALQFTPTYGMYAVSAGINDVVMINLPLDTYFDIDVDALNPFLEDVRLKIIFICSPNNPTGNVMNREAIISILNRFKGIVFIDEAYAEFAEGESCIDLIGLYNNLIVSRTFSKARALAGARVGVAFAHGQIIQFLNTFKPPYNVSCLNQRAALTALAESHFRERVNQIITEREILKTELKKFPFVKIIFPSNANFLLVKVNDADDLYRYLIRQTIIVRNRHKQVPNTLRITVGSPQENNRLINALKTYK